MDKPDINVNENSEVYFEEAAEADVPPLTRSSRRKKSRRGLAIFSAILLVLGGYFGFHQVTKKSDSLKVQGKVALTESGLRSIVKAKKLTVFWTGPLAGAKYSLVATAPGIAYIRYLPGGVGLADTKNAYKAVGTYVQKNAFAVNQSAGKVTGNVGFTNVDGNAVFYTKTRPTNVYMGIKGQDIQLEIFDPLVDQALGVALIRNMVSQIK